MRAYLNPYFSGVEAVQPDDLVALGFVSRSTHELGILGLVNLCVQSYCNNVERGLTGVLFFDGMHFGQVLEGRRDAIDECWQVIQRDLRHEDLCLVGQKDIGRRSFFDWTLQTPDAESIVMLFPELGEMFRPLQQLYDGSEVTRVMGAYPAMECEQRTHRYLLPSIH